MRALRIDLRDARRELSGRPLASAMVAALIGLGLGLAVAVAGALDALWLRPHGFPEPERLVLLWEAHPRQTAGWRLASTTAADFWHEELETFEGLAVSRLWRPVLDAAEPRSLDGLLVSEAFLDVLGVTPLRGRAFTADDHVPGAPPVVILSHAFWQSELGGDPEALGSTLPWTGSGPAPAVVIGILPPAPRLAPPAVAAPAEVLAPLPTVPSRGENAAPGSPSGARYLQVVGRLRSDTGVDLARAELATVSRRLAAAYPATHGEWEGAVESLAALVAAPRRQPLTVMAVAAVGVLAVVWLDAGLLLLARAAARGRAQALHLALGARPRDLFRRIFLEGLLVAGLGGMAGLAAAVLVLPRSLPAAWAPELAGGWLAAGPGAGGRSAAGTVALLGMLALPALALVLLTAFAVAALPGWRAARHDPGVLLRVAAPSRTGGRGAAVMISIQVALTFVLLTTAISLARGFEQLTRTEPGFDAAPVVAFELRSVTAPGERPLVKRWSEAHDEVAALPQVSRSALASHLPMQGRGMGTTAAPASDRGGEPIRVELVGVSRSYFVTLDIPILAGGDLRPVAEPGLSRDVVISAGAARALWPESAALRDVIGRRLLIDWQDSEPWDVVGVVGDVRLDGFDAAARPAVYLPFPVLPHRALSLVARTEAEPSELVSTVRARLRSADRALVIESARPWAETIDATLGPRRGVLRGAMGFAALALVLAMAATAGVLAERVARRRRELAVRSALGAPPRRLAFEVVAYGLRWSVLGLVAGVVVHILQARLVTDLVFEAPATDPVAFLAAGAILLVTVTAAAVGAARKVTTIDPAVVLRGL